MNLMNFILLGGLKHCGKTSLGRLLAQDMGYSFFDLDDLTVEETSGKWNSPRAVWKNLGPHEFQRLEEEAARSFVTWHLPRYAPEGVVLALGGGTIENAGAMAWLSDRGVNVYLRAPSRLLFKRIMAGGRPPFLPEENPEEAWQAIYMKRHALYTDFARIVHDVDESELSVNARRLLAKLEKNNVW
ncbi:MAG: shikimate kinase [Spirochaetales bacterium]|nr:MAG: shikimate kinase [Spirochaetales bacterium]